MHLVVILIKRRLRRRFPAPGRASCFELRKAFPASQNTTCYFPAKILLDMVLNKRADAHFIYFDISKLETKLIQ